MRISRLPSRWICLLLIPLGAALAAGTSPAGRWSGTIDVHDVSSGTDVTTEVTVVLDEPKPGQISGKIGREGDSDAVAIQNGKLDGNHVYFEAVSDETSGPMKFYLTLAGDEMKGEMKGSVSAQDISGTVRISRSK